MSISIIAFSDKKTYRTGEKIKAMIQSQTDRQLDIFYPTITIQKLEGNTYKPIPRFFSCPCNNVCPIKQFETLAPRSLLTVEWDQKEDSCQGLPDGSQALRSQVSAGTYRLSVTAASSNNDRNHKTVYSANFTIR